MSKHKGKKLSELSGKIWANGELIDWQDATVHVLSHGLQYGTGAFEGVRSYKTDKGAVIFRLADHTRRLLNSTRAIGIESPYSFEELCNAQLDVVAANGLGNSYLRPIMFFDDSQLGLGIDNHDVLTYIAAMEWGAYLGQEGLEKGITVGVSSYRRHNPGISMCRAKVTGNYINSVLASHEAKCNGFDEALLLDTEGYISEGPGENLFAIKDGILYTPTLDTALDGITRNSVLTLAKDHGIEIRERRMTRDELYSVEEAFFTGTAAEVTPIREVDRHTIGSGKRGPVTETLQADYFDCVYGRNDKHLDWLSLVDPAQRAK